MGTEEFSYNWDRHLAVFVREAFFPHALGASPSLRVRLILECNTGRSHHAGKGRRSRLRAWPRMCRQVSLLR